MLGIQPVTVALDTDHGYFVHACSGIWVSKRYKRTALRSLGA